MSRILFDFVCANSRCRHEFEELVSPDIFRTECPECQQLTADRQVSAPRIDPKLGVSGDFPTMAKKWANTRRQRQQHSERLHRDHGDIR